MVRNSVKYVSYKDLKEVTKDLKEIYTAAIEEMAHFELKQLGKMGLNILLFLIFGKVIGQELRRFLPFLRKLERLYTHYLCDSIGNLTNRNAAQILIFSAKSV